MNCTLYGMFLLKKIDYPPHLVSIIMKLISEKIINDKQEVTSNTENKQIQLPLSYAGKQGHHLILRMNRQLNKYIKYNVKVIITYQGTKHLTRLQINDQTNFELRSHLEHYGKCP